ncbi:MAG: hypothetical protein U9N11_01215 [Campylobacterota bacterium]|nr:hypothetical protein [Campylobacterota bacterium]
MFTTINMTFYVTASQKTTIESRMRENGFDELSAYLKVVALKTQTFSAVSATPSTGLASIEIGFKVTESQKTKIEDKMKESGFENLTSYLQYVALHGVVSAVVEVRSSGDFDSMLARIAKAKANNRAQ